MTGFTIFEKNLGILQLYLVLPLWVQRSKTGLRVNLAFANALKSFLCQKNAEKRESKPCTWQSYRAPTEITFFLYSPNIRWFCDRCLGIFFFGKILFFNSLSGNFSQSEHEAYGLDIFHLYIIGSYLICTHLLQYKLKY